MVASQLGFILGGLLCYNFFSSAGTKPTVARLVPSFHCNKRWLVLKCTKAKKTLFYGYHEDLNCPGKSAYRLSTRVGTQDHQQKNTTITMVVLLTGLAAWLWCFQPTHSLFENGLILSWLNCYISYLELNDHSENNENLDLRA